MPYAVRGTDDGHRPLRPTTCQSVRMQFIAMPPGVHPVDTLTLTDVETGYSVNLRSIMDIVVHDRADDP
jgi:hypothetical protein